MADDFTTQLECDADAFIGPVEAAAQAAEESGERVITIVQRQETSWLNFAGNVIPALAGLTSSVIDFAATQAQIAWEKEQMIYEAGWGSVGVAIAGARLAMTSYGQAAIGVLTSHPVLLGAIATTAATVAGAYYLATSEILGSNTEVEQSTKRVGTAWKELESAAMQLGNVALRPFTDLASGTAAFIALVNPLPGVLKSVADAASGALSYTAKQLQGLATAGTQAQDVLVTAVFVTQSWFTATAAATQGFYEETAALRAMAAETERVIALQEKHRSGYQTLGQIQEAAATAAEHAQKVAEIGHLTTMEAIDAEIRALQQLSAEHVRAGTFDAGRAADLFNALERQKEGVRSGRITEDTVKDEATKANPVEQQIAAMQKQFDALFLGEEQAAIAAAQAAGATQEQIDKLTELMDGKERLTRMIQAEKAAEQQLAEQKRRSDQIQQQADDRIAKARDQIDRLTGSATSAEIAMRELTRQGFTDEQIAKIMDAEEQLKKLQDSSGPTQAGKAAFAGSAEANATMFRGLGGGQADKQVALATEQNKLTKELITAVKENKPEPPPEVAD